MQTTGDTAQHISQQPAAGPDSSDPAPENGKDDNPASKLWNAIRNSRLLTKFILLLILLILPLLVLLLLLVFLFLVLPLLGIASILEVWLTPWIVTQVW